MAILIQGMYNLTLYQIMEYCEIINFRAAQFSWIHEKEYIRGDVYFVDIGWLV